MKTPLFFGWTLHPVRPGRTGDPFSPERTTRIGCPEEIDPCDAMSLGFQYAGLCKMIRTVFCLLFSVVTLCGCASPSRKTQTPKFPGMLMEPLGVRLTDQRTETEKGNRPNPDWIYFRAEGAQQADLLLQYLGGALASLHACPSVRILPEDAADDTSRVLLQLDYVKGYSRWPVKVKETGNTVLVEGGGTMRWRLWVDGRQTAKGEVKETPPPLPVPVSLIRSDNVRLIVQRALSNQYEKTVTHLLEELLWQLAEDWPVDP